MQGGGRILFDASCTCPGMAKHRKVGEGGGAMLGFIKNMSSLDDKAPESGRVVFDDSCVSPGMRKHRVREEGCKVMFDTTCTSPELAKNKARWGCGAG